MSSEGTINGKEKAVPDEIQKLSFLTTTTTWDNLYINLETASGKGTIHTHTGYETKKM